MINVVPVFGWLLCAAFSMSLAVPLWYVWTACGLGLIYGTALPEAWQAIPYWHCVGLVMVAWTIGDTLVPSQFWGAASRACAKTKGSATVTESTEAEAEPHRGVDLTNR